MNIDYGRYTATKTTRYSKAISATIQKAFLGTSKSKSSLIKKLTAELQCACVFVTSHCLDGADFSTDRDKARRYRIY